MQQYIRDNSLRKKKLSMQRGLFLYWKPREGDLHHKKCIVNFGPQHPAAHGVLRLILQLEGELITRLDPHIGLLHRGTEHLIESKYYHKSIPYFDRLDYVSMASQEHAYCLSVERLLGVTNITNTVHMQRILVDELTRIMNHMLAVSCHALDVGNMSALFWAFEIREKLMEFYERLTGARMHAAIHSFTNPHIYRINIQFLKDVLTFIPECYTTLNEMHNVLSYNKIWKQRLVNIGVYDYKIAQSWSLTGVLLRCTGVRRDLRLNSKEVYSGYSGVFLKSFLGLNGDCFDRFNIRMLEMAESLSVVNQAASTLIKLTGVSESDKVKEGFNSFIVTSIKQAQSKKNYYAYMEDLIEHFLSWHTGVKVLKSVNSTYIESPKGEFGVTTVSDNTANPLRCKIRSPSYFNLQFLPQLTKRHFIADLATLVGTIDIVFGEVDR